MSEWLATTAQQLLVGPAQAATVPAGLALIALAAALGGALMGMHLAAGALGPRLAALFGVLLGTSSAIPGALLGLLLILQ